MTRDFYLRFSSMAAMLAFFRRPAVQGMIGDLIDPEDASRLRDLRGKAAVVVKSGITVTPATYDGNGVELTPAVMDPRPWLLLRLRHDRVRADERTGTGWVAKSRLVRHIWLTGVRGTKRGVPMARLTLGTGWVEVYSTPGLKREGILPFVIAGGPIW